MADPPPELDPRKIRMGLGIITGVVVVALLGALVVGDPLGRLILGAVAVVGIVRAYLLSRSLRADRPTP